MVAPPVRHPPRPHPQPRAALQVGTALSAWPARRYSALRGSISSSLIGRPSSISNAWNVASVSAAMMVLKCPSEFLLEHGRGRGLVDVVAERLQQPRRAGHRGPALRVVEETLRARPVEHPDPQPARIGAGLLRQRARQRRCVVRLARHAAC